MESVKIQPSFWVETIQLVLGHDSPQQGGGSGTADAKLIAACVGFAGPGELSSPRSVPHHCPTQSLGRALLAPRGGNRALPVLVPLVPGTELLDSPPPAHLG